MQALVACGCFCSLLQSLVRAAPALNAATTPTLAALAELAAEFAPMQPPTPPEEKENDGWSQVSTRKKKHKVSGYKHAGIWGCVHDPEVHVV